MRLDVKFSAAVGRADLSDYVRSLEIDATCFDEDMDNEYVVGRLAMNQILWADAQADGVSIFQVCDNDSQGMHDLCEILTKGKQEFRRDLGINEPVSHVLFLYGAVFHACIHPHRQGILDAAFRLFGEESLAVMRSDTTGLSGADLAELGFRKVARSELIFRHSMLRTPFGDQHPRGIDAEGVVAEPAFQDWVTQEWQRGTGDGESAEGGDTA